MAATLTPELRWLILTVLMTALMWVPYIINRMREQGFVRALWDPHGLTDTQTDWARRMMQAHANAVENLVIFAPLIIAIQLAGLGTTVTGTASAVYFFSRIGHYVVFTMGIPLLRVITFIIGFAAQMVLALTLIRAF